MYFSTFLFSLFILASPSVLNSCFLFQFHFIPSGKPQIVEKTDDSVTMTWSRSSSFGASPITGYTVEMYGRNDTDGWVPVATNLENTTYTHVGLVPGINYFFVVRAENSYGVSIPSTLSEAVIVGIVSRSSVAFDERTNKKWNKLRTVNFDMTSFQAIPMTRKKYDKILIHSTANYVSFEIPTKRKVKFNSLLIWNTFSRKLKMFLIHRSFSASFYLQKHYSFYKCLCKNTQLYAACFHNFLFLVFSNDPNILLHFVYEKSL